jgi:hypothetical protein
VVNATAPDINLIDMKNVTLSKDIQENNVSVISKIKKSAVAEIISSLLVLLFMYAAITKLLDYSTFKLQLAQSPFITKFSGFTVWSLPSSEILVSLVLVNKKFRLLGLYASLFLMTMFTAYIYAMLHFSFYIPCSCGGIISKMDWTQHLWFNTFFVILSIVGILLETTRLSQRTT